MSQSPAALAYGADPSRGINSTHDDPPADVTCICIDDADLALMHDLMAIGLTQREACLRVWSPELARDLTPVEQWRRDFQIRFPWLRLPEVAA